MTPRGASIRHPRSCPCSNSKPPTGLFICGASLALLLTGCPKPRQVIELSISCPHATPRQVESAAIAFEVVLAGMPGGTETFSVSSPGLLRIYQVYRLRPGTDHSQELSDRLGVMEAGSVTLATSKPMIREIADVPLLANGPPTRMLEIRPDKEALLQAAIVEPQFWNAIAERCDPAEHPDEAKIGALTLWFKNRELPLTDLATVQWTTQPQQIVRLNGVRLPELRARRQ